MCALGCLEIVIDIVFSGFLGVALPVFLCLIPFFIRKSGDLAEFFPTRL
jgi:hypothetical protein